MTPQSHLPFAVVAALRRVIVVPLKSGFGVRRFHRYYVLQDAAVHTAHDPTHENYKPFATRPPRVNSATHNPKDVFRTLDADGNGLLQYSELKQMKLLDGQGIEFGNESTSGMVRDFFIRKYSDRLRSGDDPSKTFDVLDKDGNNLLTRAEAKRANQFFKDDLRRRVR